MKLKEFQNLEEDKKLEAIFVSVEKTRKYFKWTLFTSLVFIVLPFIVLPFVISQFMSAYDFSSLGL